jgi:hypothetical protein
VKKTVFVSYISPVHYNVVELDEKRYAPAQLLGIAGRRQCTPPGFTLGAIYRYEHMKHAGCDGSCLSASDSTENNPAVDGQPSGGSAPVGNLIDIDDSDAIGMCTLQRFAK